MRSSRGFEFELKPLDFVVFFKREIDGGVEGEFQRRYRFCLQKVIRLVDRIVFIRISRNQGDSEEEEKWNQKKDFGESESTHGDISVFVSE